MAHKIIPQIAPMNWIILFIIFTLCWVTVLIKLYYFK